MAQRNITSRTRKALDRLPMKRREYVALRAQGATIEKAAHAVGVSRRMGNNYEKDDDVKAAYREVMRAALPLHEIAELVRGGAYATMPVFDSTGRKKKDRPDWRTRKAYIEMARKDAGYIEEKADQNSTMIAVRVEHIGSNNAQTAEPIITIAAEAN